MRARYGVPLGITAVGAAGLLYSAGFEARSFRLRRVTVPVLPPGMRPLRILQVSDIHMVSGQRKKQRWLRSLAGLRPDFVLNTGDNLSDPEGVPEVLDALGPLMELPGAYVFGSNDYYGPTLRNPARYLFEKAAGRHGLNGNKPVVGAVHNPWEDLRDGFDTAGWLNLTNTRGTLKIEGTEIELTGLDDPHIKRDRYARVAAWARPRPPTSRWASYTPRTCAAWTPSRPTATPDPGRPHPRRPDLPPLLRRLRHQLRPGHGPRQGPLQAYGGGPDLVHARLGGLRREPLHTGPLRLPAGGVTADAGGAGVGVPGA